MLQLKWLWGSWGESSIIKTVWQQWSWADFEVNGSNDISQINAAIQESSNNCVYIMPWDYFFWPNDTIKYEAVNWYKSVKIIWAWMKNTKLIRSNSSYSTATHMIDFIWLEHFEISGLEIDWNVQNNNDINWSWVNWQSSPFCHNIRIVWCLSWKIEWLHSHSSIRSCIVIWYDSISDSSSRSIYINTSKFGNAWYDHLLYMTWARDILIEASEIYWYYRDEWVVFSWNPSSWLTEKDVTWGVTFNRCFWNSFELNPYSWSNWPKLFHSRDITGLEWSDLRSISLIDCFVNNETDDIKNIEVNSKYFSIEWWGYIGCNIFVNENAEYFSIKRSFLKSMRVNTWALYLFYIKCSHVTIDWLNMEYISWWSWTMRWFNISWESWKIEDVFIERSHIVVQDRYLDLIWDSNAVTVHTRWNSTSWWTWWVNRSGTTNIVEYDFTIS